MRTHYDTLGVSETATRDEIKTAYRRLCMETHPDLAKCGRTKAANLEKFKKISEAHRVLSNDNSRKRYNFEMEETRFRVPRHSNNARRNPHAHMFNTIVEGFFRPRNLFFGLTIGFISMGYLKSLTNQETDPKTVTGKNNLVEAWKNPKTGRWEQPAPWDETYKKLRPKLEFIPREEVYRRAR